MKIEKTKKLDRIDMHLHGYLSSDSSILDYHELCKKALDYGYKAIAFTEHYDLIDSEIVEYGIPPLHRYYDLIDLLRTKFPDLVILAGVELGEPHRVQEFSRRLFAEQPPDYIIGSLHVTRDGLNVSSRSVGEMTDEEITGYYLENLEMVQLGGFDTLGHLGIFKRGWPNHTKNTKKHFFKIIDEILREIIKKNICLEVNNSGLKTVFSEVIPEPEILARYRDMGGELITVSSDAHDLEHFNRFYDKTLDKLRQIGFRGIWWKNMKIWERIEI